MVVTQSLGIDHESNSMLRMKVGGMEVAVAVGQFDKMWQQSVP